MRKPDREFSPKALALAAAVAAIGAAVGAPVEQALAGVTMEGKRPARTARHAEPITRGAAQFKFRQGTRPGGLGPSLRQGKDDGSSQGKGGGQGKISAPRPGGLGPSLRQGKDDGSSQGKGGGSGQGKTYAPTPGGVGPGLRQGREFNRPGGSMPGLKQR